MRAETEGGAWLVSLQMKKLARRHQQQQEQQNSQRLGQGEPQGHGEQRLQWKGCQGVYCASHCCPLVLSVARLFPHILPTLLDSSHSSTLMDSLQAMIDKIPHEETLGLSRDLLGSHH